MSYTNATLEITTKIGCSINCKFCPQNKLIKTYFEPNEMGEKAPEYMSLETFKKCIDKVPKEVKIDFAGMCEPWLNSECTEMVKYAVKRGHKIRIFSTLIGMKEEDIDVLSKLEIESFVLHTPDEKENSHIKIDEKYKKVLKRLMDVKLSSLKAISSHSAIHSEIIDIISDEWVLEKVEMVDRAGNLEIDEVEKSKADGEIACDICGWELNHNILLPDGRVLLCCNDYGMKHILGNLLHENYEDLFKGTEYTNVRESMLLGKDEILCRSCSSANTFEKLLKNYMTLKEENDNLYRISQLEIKKLNSDIKQIVLAKEWNENLYKESQAEINELQDWTTQLKEARDFFEKQMENYQAEYKKACVRNDEILCEKEILQNEKTNISEKVKNLESQIEELNMKVDDYIKTLEYTETEVKKWKYKYNRLMSDKIIKKIAQKKKLDI